MADDNRYSFVVLQILVVFIIFRIESIAGCQDANDLKTNCITTAVGSSVELACNVTDTQYASWLRGVQGLALGSSVYTQWRHSYSLHHASISNSSNYFVYNLVVRKVTEDVEGLYWCKEQGCSKARVNLTVEVPPVLWLEMEHSNISNIINVTQNQETDITCKAVGGKPTVSLLWEINGEDETNGVTSETVPNEVTSILNYRPDRDDRMVTCKTSGQIAVPSLRASVYIYVSSAVTIETNQPLNEQSTSFLKHPLPILLVISTTIMITATALTVAIVMKKRSSTTECNRTSTESQNISCSMYDQFQPVSKHGFIDTSDCRYETRFFPEGIAVKDLSKGRTEPTGGKVAEGDTPEYVEVLDESPRDTHRRRDK